ncbi:cytochrome P450 [Novosphingobium endophyticum]|uniref:Cytochrome P450 n=1 Tax=Novosphingobium endophyticum TaxID=1955250 RepID=A0A916X733_9SPHN|nr:cytochrome P450 [Novosphingobium endophyticum]GGC13962.1 cytochrome P450 [Novosphingobium endophyticum]
MQTLEHRDYFTDHEILKDPYQFFEAVRAHGPVYQPPGKDYLIVTGFPETVEILNNNRDFSASIGLAGAAAPLPFEPHGSDITAQLEENRCKILGGDLLVNLDDGAHTNMRALVNRLFTPSRLKANEAFIQEYSEELVRKAVENGSVELIKEISTPFVTLVIADLLGVPAEDREHFMRLIEAAPPPGSLDSGENDYSGKNHPMVAMGGYFARYIMERLEAPRDDILTELAHANYPDGTKPQLQDLVALSVFMFGAGQDTSAKLLGNSMRYIVDVPGLQDKLREDPSLIPAFLEEVLRLEGSTKQTARLARRDTKIGDLEVPAGTKVLLALSAANRDERRWPDPEDFELNRPKIKEHVGFGRGKHVCAGAPLARVEVRVILEQFFKYTSKIDMDESKHGPRGQRELDFEPSFIIRGLADLYLKLSPSEAMKA